MEDYLETICTLTSTRKGRNYANSGTIINMFPAGSIGWFSTFALDSDHTRSIAIRDNDYISGINRMTQPIDPQTKKVEDDPRKQLKEDAIKLTLVLWVAITVSIALGWLFGLITFCLYGLLLAHYISSIMEKPTGSRKSQR
ncbi:MAG TPA: hypothetical protein VHE53_01065 [Patescibacteria group bacterium]|nr:hypothetical protein [Patescibacteria group bacterium]